jgi:hypothetical protein
LHRREGYRRISKFAGYDRGVPSRPHFTDSDKPNPGAPSRRPAYALAALYASASGAIASALLFAGLSYWAFALALFSLIALIAITRLTGKARDTLGSVAAFAFALALLLWPAELLVALGLWGHWE